MIILDVRVVLLFIPEVLVAHIAEPGAMRRGHFSSGAILAALAPTFGNLWWWRDEVL